MKPPPPSFRSKIDIDKQNKNFYFDLLQALKKMLTNDRKGHLQDYGGLLLYFHDNIVPGDKSTRFVFTCGSQVINKQSKLNHNERSERVKNNSYIWYARMHDYRT